MRAVSDRQDTQESGNRQMNTLPHLQRYLWDANWLALVQLMIFGGIIYLVAERTSRCLGVLRHGAEGPVANCLVENLTRLCMGLGLLLTFSGLYGYMAADSSGHQGPLLMALGSSAIGYSAWTICAAAAVIDGLVPNAAYGERIGACDRSHGRECQPSKTPAASAELLTESPCIVSPAYASEPPARRYSFLPLREPNNEQELDDDPGGRRRHLGGPADNADHEDGTALGSLDGYQQREFGGEELEPGDADSDLDDEEWGYRLLAGDEPTIEDGRGESPPATAGHARPKPPFGGSPTM